jgi:glutamine amidotransferase
LENRVCIVDYGVGNISTLVTLLSNANLPHIVSKNIQDIQNSRVAVLAGVGSFDYGMSRLNDLGITDAIRDLASNPQQKVVGICLGMQLLFEGSEEGCLPGIGLLPGVSLKFPSELAGNKLRVPHMGWNVINKTKHSSSISAKFDSHRFYFVHSYYVTPSDPSIVKYSAEYGIEFPAIIESNNVFAAQFHPEKSSLQGRTLMLEMLE